MLLFYMLFTKNSKSASFEKAVAMNLNFIWDPTICVDVRQYYLVARCVTWHFYLIKRRGRFPVITETTRSESVSTRKLAGHSAVIAQI